MRESRRYPRYNVPFRVRYASLGITPVEASTIAVNISKSGIRIPISRLIKVRDIIKLEIDMLDESCPIRALGKIVWTKESGRFELDAGLVFTKVNVTDSVRLMNMLLTLKPSENTI